MNPAPTLHTIRREYKLPNFDFDFPPFFSPLFSESWKLRRNFDLLVGYYQSIHIDMSSGTGALLLGFWDLAFFHLDGRSKNGGSKLRTVKQTKTRSARYYN